MIIQVADNNDKEELINYFNHYKNEKIIKNRVESYLKYNKMIIAKENNKIVGVLQWHIKENPQSGVVEFEEIFVNKELRGKGIGSKLVDFAIKDVKEYFISNNLKSRKIFLFTNKNNIPARKLYEKYGFKFIAELNELFSDNEKEAFYCLSLDN